MTKTHKHLYPSTVTLNQLVVSFFYFALMRQDILKLVRSLGHCLSDWLAEWLTHLDTEVSSVHVVSQEEVAGVAGWPSHFKQLHEVKKLAVDVSTHWAATDGPHIDIY